MPTKIKLPVPRFEVHRNEKKEFNYRTIGKNGKSIGGEQHQGFKNFADVISNIKANGKVFGVEVSWDSAKREVYTSDGTIIPLIEVKK